VNLLIVIALALLGLWLLVQSLSLLRRRRIIGGLLTALAGLVFLLLPACIAVVAASMVTYTRLTHETRALQADFSRTGEHAFTVVLTFPDGEVQRLALEGDEWQVDARIIKWKPLANIAGFDTVYRLERISGRYATIADERSRPHSVYALSAPARIDLWSLVRHATAWLPGIDALYGSAAYVPMADRASFAVMVTQSGLIVRPLDEAARQAVGGWH
jgi:hypothetical protein